MSIFLVLVTCMRESCEPTIDGLDAGINCVEWKCDDTSFLVLGRSLLCGSMLDPVLPYLYRYDATRKVYLLINTYRSALLQIMHAKEKTQKDHNNKEKFGGQNQVFDAVSYS